MKNQSYDVDRTNESMPTLARVSYPVVPFMKEVEMTGRIDLTQSNQGHHRVRVFAIEMVKVILAVFMLLAFSIGTARAAEIALPSAVVNAPDCGSQPICGYIQAHRSKVVLFECWYQPACYQLTMHRYGITRNADHFLAAVQAYQSQPGEFDPQVIMTGPTLVHSGPGKDFYSYGELPADFVSPMIGVSKLGDWWVIPLPLTIAPDELGWVEVATVTARNDELARVRLRGCRYFPYCQQYLRIYEPSYAIENLLGIPIVVVTGR
jgi:hypothetical protein